MGLKEKKIRGGGGKLREDFFLCYNRVRKKQWGKMRECVTIEQDQWNGSRHSGFRLSEYFKRERESRTILETGVRI